MVHYITIISIPNDISVLTSVTNFWIEVSLTTNVMSRTNLLFSLGVIPAFMGLGHLAPAIGAIHTATGLYQFPGRLLGLIGTISALVDCTHYRNFSHVLC
jgi:hypothetical protein